MLIHRRACWIAPWAAACSPAARADDGALRVAAPGAADAFGVYAVRLLNEALRRLDEPPLVLTPSNQSPARIALEVELPHGTFDILWGMASRDWEHRFVPIRFALDRGLIGVRVVVVREAWLESIDWRTLVQREPAGILKVLQRAPMGSGTHWPDTQILQSNDFRVVTAAGPDALFRMLDAARIDLFPRSVLEVRSELAAHRDLRLAVLPQVALAYPAVSQAYVRRERADLAHRLGETLHQMARHGEVKRLFDAHFQRGLDELGVPTRRLLWLRNPHAPEAAAPPEPPLPWLTRPQ